MFKNLLKATVALTVTPVAAVVDILTCIPRAIERPNEDFWSNTTKSLKSAERNFEEAMRK